MKLDSKKFKLLIIADPVAGLNSQSDTTLYLMRAAVEREVPSVWAEANSLSWLSEQVVVMGGQISQGGSRFQLPILLSKTRHFISDFTHILIRKEPPFDASYQRLCWMLRGYEKRVSFLNAPSTLLLEHEKMIALDAITDGVISLEESIDTCVTEDLSLALEFAGKLKSEKLVMKPWMGHGGRDILLFDRQEFLGSPQKFWRSEELTMLQAFQDAVLKTGDRRVLVMKGRFIGDVVRLPAEGGFVSNLVRGGRAVSAPLTSKEQNIIDRISPWLWNRGILFAGLDFIDSRLSEVNVTCPTGLGAFENLNQRNLAPEILEAWMGPS